MLSKMSLVVLLFITTFSMSSWAFPALGDYVRFEAMYERSPVVMEKEVLAHDKVNDTFTIRTFVSYKDQVIKDETYVLPHLFLYTPAKIQNVLKTCSSREGASGEMIVDRKKIKVCEFYNEGSQLTDILGPVPFGQVRFQIYLEGEDFLDFNLTKFIFGQIF